jgi:hypothetical protein
MKYFTAFTWRVDVYDTETEQTITGDDWTFTTRQRPSGFDYDRSDDYDADLVWAYNPDDAEYQWLTPGEAAAFDIVLTGGGSYKQNIVIVGHEKIFFGEV